MKYQAFKAFLRKRYSLPKERAVKRTIQAFTLTERAVFTFFTAIFVLAGLSLLWQVSEAFLVEVPTEGGSLTEGIVGNPRFINPVLALSEADKTLTSLIYSGLVHISPSGKIENDLAESIEVSKDLLTYTVKIRDDAKFHDGTQVTADDVVFTTNKIIDPLIKSPRRGNWEGVTISKIDDETVSFTLKRPYAPFIYNLATGILPRHIWKNVTADEFSFSQFNNLPVGSGPYKISRVERNEGGIPDYYSLTPSDSGERAEPYLKYLNFRFYPSESMLIEAYNNGEVESLAGISPDHLNALEANDREVLNAPLPRVFATFFNQSHSKVLADSAVRKALDLTAPRTAIVNEVFSGYATAINTPFPAGLYSWTSFDTEHEDTATNLEKALETLGKAGWKKNETTGLLEKKTSDGTMTLSFSISTGDAPELKAVAEKLKSAWEALGAEISVLTFEAGELNQSVIRPRNFDALLFGEMVGKEADLYPFWHSSQRNDPGLNIASYANSKADRLLEEARVAPTQEAVEAKNLAFSQEMSKDLPAVFLYTPNFLYVLPGKVHSASIGNLLSSPERFAGVGQWYVETDNVWKIFLP